MQSPTYRAGTQKCEEAALPPFLSRRIVTAGSYMPVGQTENSELVMSVACIISFHALSLVVTMMMSIQQMCRSETRVL